MEVWTRHARRRAITATQFLSCKSGLFDGCDASRDIARVICDVSRFVSAGLLPNLTTPLIFAQVRRLGEAAIAVREQPSISVRTA